MIAWLKHLRPVIWVLIISLVLFLVLVNIVPKEQGYDPAILPWNAYVNEQGQLSALGIILDQSTLKELSERYGRDIEVKLFELPTGERSAEAYMHSTYVGTIHTAIVAKLQLTEDQLDQYFERGARTTISKQGAREVLLNNQDTLALFNYPISEITLVPRRRLTAEAIEKRFGQPASKKTDDEGIDYWYFPEKGLELLLLEGSNDILRYKTRLTEPQG